MATCVTWGLGAVVLSDVIVWQYDDVTDRWLPQPDTPYTYTREGWGRTTWKTHGRLAERLPGPDEATVVFWGDSYVEALQVDDREKMFNVFTRLVAGRGSDLRGVGVALSGWDLADYHDLLPKLRSRLGRPVRHVFVVQMKDVLPNEKTLRQDALPMFHPQPHTPGSTTIRPYVYRWQLSSFWIVPRDAAEAMRALRVAPGPAPPKPDPDAIVPPENPHAVPAFWARMFAALQAEADAPIAFVLLPHRPQIRNGRVDPALHPDEDILYTAFVDTCRRRDIDCIDMSEPFADFHRRTGRFPRGFVNTQPSTGHLNADGQRLVAQAVANWLLEQEGRP